MRFILLLSLTLLLPACVSTLKDFKPEKLKADEAAVIGNVAVEYNGVDMTSKCSVCFGSTEGPCYKLDETGFVALKVKAGRTSLKRVSCLDVSEQHYDFRGAGFETKPLSKTYFGDVKVKWKNKGGFKVSTMFGAIGAVIDQSSNDGAAKFTVSRDPKKTWARYGEIQSGVDALKPHEDLVKEGQ